MANSSIKPLYTLLLLSDLQYISWFVFTTKCKHAWVCVYLSKVEALPNVDVNSCCFQRLNVPLGECYLFLWLVLSPSAQCRLVRFYQLVQSETQNVHLMNWQSSVCAREIERVTVERESERKSKWGQWDAKLIAVLFTCFPLLAKLANEQTWTPAVSITHIYTDTHTH